MSVETVLSIVESPAGGVVTRVVEMTAAEASAFHVARWIERLRFLQQWGMQTYIKDMAASFIGRQAAFQTAMAQLAAQETAATLAASNAAAAAAEGTLIAGAGTTVAAVTIPVVAMVAVAVALGPVLSGPRGGQERGVCLRIRPRLYHRAHEVGIAICDRSIVGQRRGPQRIRRADAHDPGQCA